MIVTRQDREIDLKTIEEPGIDRRYVHLAPSGPPDGFFGDVRQPQCFVAQVARAPAAQPGGALNLFDR
ncbi:hypothetical protein GCM10027097_29390 [Amycolatopsis acidiphila]